MNMKRFLIAVLVLTLFLSACQSRQKSSKPETKPNTTTSETEKPQENENQSVSFYACPDNLLHPSLYMTEYVPTPRKTELRPIIPIYKMHLTIFRIFMNLSQTI